MRLSLAAVVILYLAGCGTSSTPAALEPGMSPDARAKLKTPVVIGVDPNGERLVYWSMDKHGGATPEYLSGRLGIEPLAMVANGNVVTIAGYSPPELLSYDVATGVSSTIADTYGSPLDLAIGKTGTLYALNDNNVAVFPVGGSSYELSCSYLSRGAAIAVDNEGDVLVNGLGPHRFTGVVEYLAGSSKCSKLPLKLKEQNPLGLGVDPKTDDLIVEDWGGCAGGNVGRITVFEPPYGSKVRAQHFLNAECPGRFRLDASSSNILVLDGLDGVRADRRVRDCGVLWIDQRSYPGAQGHSAYTGGCAQAVTTIPNTLPN